MVDDVGLHRTLTTAARAHRGRVAILDGDRSWTFDELERRVSTFAGRLDTAGVRRGDRVAVRMANRVEFPVAVLALSRLGASAVLLSPAWKEREIDHALELTGADHAVVDVVDDGDAGALSARLGADAVTDVDVPVRLTVEGPSPSVAPSDEAVLVFSSGTTGLPKAVRHTHASLTAATGHWVTALGLGPSDHFQVSTPPSHILGLLNLLAAFRAGASVRLHRRFDLDVELASIESERMTLEMAVAPIVLAMANRPDLERFDLSSLRFIMWGATPVTASVAATVTARTGVPILAAYGTSEIPVLAVNPIEDPLHWRLDSPGLAPADVDVRVVDLATGAELPSGSTGELEARGPSTMAGYLPEQANADAFHDGWYRTGDVGRIDPDGWVVLTDRSKDMIKVSGFQVAPAELESVLLGHPGVLDCAVFGVHDDTTGEAPVAAVQLDPATHVDDDELRDLVAQTLAGYKRLRQVVRVATIPRLPSGKALRRELRERWDAGALNGAEEVER